MSGIHHKNGRSPWTALIITCKTREFAEVVQRKLDLKKKYGILPSDLLFLCIEYPQDHIGSGGATINALLVLAEHLSARLHHTVVTVDVLKQCRVLIMHMGRNFLYSPMGRGFMPCPVAKENRLMENLVTNFDLLYSTITSKLAVSAPTGMERKVVGSIPG